MHWVVLDALVNRFMEQIESCLLADEPRRIKNITARHAAKNGNRNGLNQTEYSSAIAIGLHLMAPPACQV